jgi:hypothetical protein
MAPMRIRDLQGLSARNAIPLTLDQALESDRLFAEYCARPQHRDRLTPILLAALRAGANSVARHGPPPKYNARLAYRMHKKRRAKLLAIAIYGDPATAKKIKDIQFSRAYDPL